MERDQEKINTCSLKSLPFYNLTDQEFNAFLGTFSREIDEIIDLFNVISNPDKFDDTDPDLMLEFPFSNYLSMEEMNKTLNMTGNKAISMFHFNIRSLSKNISLLNDFLYSLDKKPDILGITETRLNENSVTNTSLPGYHFFHNDSPTAAGGTAIYVSEDLNTIIRTDIKFEMHQTESSWIEINPGNGKSHIIVGCVYRHPRANIAQFTQQLEEIIKKLAQSKYQVFILGDINIDFLKYNTHTPTEEYLDMLFSNSYIPLITKPTRLTNHTKTLIDHIYTNTDYAQIKPGIVCFDISDHLPIFCSVDAQVQRQKTVSYYRDYSKFDEKSYLNDIDAIDWNMIMQNSKDLNEKTLKIIEKIISTTDKHAPVKKLSNNKRKLFNKPWITKGILKSIKQKQKMYKTHFHSNDIKKIEQYKKYSNKLNHLKNQSKKEYFNRRFSACKNNLKSTWKLIGTLIKRKSKGQVNLTKITRNNQTYTKKIDIANQLNDHFINVGPNLANAINKTYENPTKYISNSPVNSFVMSTVTSKKVQELFSRLDDNKSSLNVPNKLIRIAAKQLSSPFTQIFNESILSGIVPNVLKISRVTPLYKSGPMTDPNNYRPISILSPFSKILEKIIHDQLQSFLDKNKILFKYQFGFRKKHSTEQAILEITETLKNNIDNKLVTCGLFLDFSKAFDTVNHKILLSKLNRYGIRGNALSWFTNYLQNRQQYVKIDNYESTKLTMKCGVPQGSTLGPLLFLLYINDMPNSTTKLSFRIFADDTNVFYACNNAKDLESVMNQELTKILHYCDINKLSINFKKTNFMILSSKRNIPKINIMNIDCKTYIKYLGTYIDHKLNWEQQIRHVNSKLSKNTGIINKLKHYVNLKTLRQLYFNLIYPYLHYAILSWGNTYKTRLEKLNVTHNRIVKNIFFANNRESANPYYALLEILKIENIVKLKTGLLTYKIISNTNDLPEPFYKYLRPVKDYHSYNTRYAVKQNIHRPKIRTNYGAHSFKYYASKLWETIPIHVKNSKSSNIFKHNYKLFLLTTQN